MINIKIKLSKNQWEEIGKKSGWMKKAQLEDSNLFTMLCNQLDNIKQIIDDGQRAFGLKKGINNCPNFDNPIYKEAWKAGYRSSMHKKTLHEAFNDFMKQYSLNAR